jgi:hypothetical protein
LKRLLLLVLAALALPAAAFAAFTSGGSTTITNGQVTLVSDATHAYSSLNFDNLNGQAPANLTSLKADVVTGANWGGGSPRFEVGVKKADGTEKNIFVYLGDAPNFTFGATGDTGNLLDAGARVDSTQLRGPFYGTWQDALNAAAAGGYNAITGISLVVDSGWISPSGQAVVVNSVSINGTAQGFASTAPTKEDCKNGGWQALNFKNQGACVSSFAASR